MKLVIAWDGDHIGRQVGRASLKDDVANLRHISQNIDRGNEIWKSWVERNGGEIISFGGDEGRAEIEAERLEDLNKVREQYAGAVGSSVSVGVGSKLSEADKALLVAKMRGGNRVLLYSEEVEEDLKQSKEKQKPRTEVDKLAEEYMDQEPDEKNAEAGYGEDEDEMSKYEFWESLAGNGLYKAGESIQAPAGILEMPDEQIASLNADVGGGGMTGAHPAVPAAAPQSPMGEASEHSQGEGMRNFVANNAPPAPELTHAASDEDMLHQAAAQGQHVDQLGMQGPAPVDQEKEQLKAGIAQILQQVKAQAPVLEQMKEQAPDLYNSVTGIVQAMIAMAKELFADDPQAAQGQPPAGDGGGDEQVGETPENPSAREGSPVQKSEPLFDFEGHLSKKAPPGFSEETMHKLKAKHGVESAFKIAWAAHNKMKKEEAASNVIPFPSSRTKPEREWEANKDNYAVAHHIRTKGRGKTAREAYQAANQPMRKDDLIPGGQAEGMRPEQFDPEEMRAGMEEEMQEHGDPKYCQEIAMDHLSEDPQYYSRKKLHKKLPMPHAAAHHNPSYPVGTAWEGAASDPKRKDTGKVKVHDQPTQENPKGRSHVVQVRAGQIMSENGHAISSRNPGGH